MEETYYYMKGKTAWTFAHWFQDEEYWEDSLKADGGPPSLSFATEKDRVQPQIEDIDRFSESGISGHQTSKKQSLLDDNLGEFPVQPSAETVQDINDGVASPSISSYSQNSGSSTSLHGKQHACDKCEKSFRKPSQHVRHVRAHSRDKPFQSSQCDKSFAQKKNLQRHLNIHTRSKSISCTQCSYRCSLRSDFTKHLRTHTGEKPFSCDVCHKSFKQSSNLKTHQRVHNKEKPYTCSTCGRSFTWSSDLKRHLLTHSKEKPHKCENCGKYFALKSNLKVHLGAHRREKPYSCQTCGKTFAYSNNRNKHSRRCKNTTTIKEQS